MKKDLMLKDILEGISYSKKNVKIPDCKKITSRVIVYFSLDSKLDLLTIFGQTNTKTTSETFK